MKTPVKAIIVAIALVIVAGIVAVIIASIGRVGGDAGREPTSAATASTAPSAAVSAAPEATGPAGSMLAADTHILAEGTKIELVEFFDFECPSCARFFPIVEEILADHEGQITYGVRFFPLQGHVNAVQAAIAAEAAAQQDRFADMFELLFAKQPEWANAGRETPEVFRAYAEELGLDMEQYDAVAADVRTRDRIAADFNAGIDAGVRSTPTFFIDGVQVQMEAFDDLAKAVDAAIRG